MTRKSKPFLAFADFGLWWAGTVPTIAGVSEAPLLSCASGRVSSPWVFHVLLNCVTCHVSKYQIYCDVDNEPLNELFNKLPFHFILRKIFLTVDHVNM